METDRSATPEASSVGMIQLVLPSDTNALGTLFGGRLMSWIDIAAAISAGKHARQTVVTASIDALHFLAPIHNGEVVHLLARVNSVARTSLEVGVRIECENLKTGQRILTARAYTTFVALDAYGKPTPLRPLLLQTPEDHRRFEEAQLRRLARMTLREELKKSPNSSSQ